ncbi:MAG TPA: DUF6666 family protein [Pirellulales bacterium]|nr:DUF6666 family protein [Pirellulales bacterium]
MHFARQFLGKWAICGAILAICWGSADVVVAQKFARRTRPTTSSKIISSTDEEISLQPVAAPSAPVGVRQVPEWQRAPMGGARYRSMASRYARRGPTQEIAFRNQPTPAAPEMIAPGAMDGEVIQERIIDDGVIQEEVVSDGYLEDMLVDAPDEMGPGCATCGGDPIFDDHECGPGCDETNCPRFVPCDGICIPRHRVEEHSLFIGPQGFTGPLDLGRNGNFGFHEGVNFAGQFGRRLGLAAFGIGYQVGANFVQSDFYGNSVNGEQTKGRDQQFVTAGLFRRARRRGFQGGAVFDYLHDNYYVKYNVGQVRAELSYLTPCGHEFGFFGAFAVRPGQGKLNTANGLTLTQGFQTINYYNMFYRYNLPNGTWGRLWAGASGVSGGMVGSDFRMPLSNNWDFNGMFNYLIPGAGAGINGLTQQGWGLSMNLVWYPGRSRNGVHNGLYRSLFNVANNGLMFVRQN